MLDRNILPVACLALAACSSYDDLAAEDLAETDAASEIDADTDAPSPATAPLPAGFESAFPDLEPDTVINGIGIDNETMAFVANLNDLTEVCSGTLVRNDIVLTARHCVTTNQTLTGPLADPDELIIFQDQPGDGLGIAALVDNVWGANPFPIAQNIVPPFGLEDPIEGQTPDVALLKLATPMEINGRLAGESVEIMGGKDDDYALVGDALICMGYGQPDCATGGGELTAGLTIVDGIDPDNGHVDLGPFGAGVGWLPSPGDSGSSCRSVNEAGEMRLVGVLSVGTVCDDTVSQSNWQASAMRPRYVRHWAESRIAQWEGEAFVDEFAATEQPHMQLEPELCCGTPPMWLTWKTGDDWFLWQFFSGYDQWDTTQEGTKYIYEDEAFADGTITVDVTSPASGAVGIIARMRDDTHYYRFSVDDGNDVVKLVVRDDDSFTELASANVPIDLDQWTELELELDNDELRGFVNGTLVFDVTDPEATYLSGRVGLYSYDASGTKFDDFVADRDDYEAPPVFLPWPW